MAKWKKINLSDTDWYNNCQFTDREKAIEFILKGGFTHYIRYPADIMGVAYGLPDNGLSIENNIYNHHILDHGTAYRNANNGKVVCTYQPYGEISCDEPLIKKWCESRGLQYTISTIGWYNTDTYLLILTAPKKNRSENLSFPCIKEISDARSLAEKIRDYYDLIFMDRDGRNYGYWLSKKHGKMFPKEIHTIISAVSTSSVLKSDVYSWLQIVSSYKHIEERGKINE